MGFEPSGGGAIQTVTVTLTSAQVLALHTTPVTVVQAPGAGLAIVPVSAMFNYQFGGTAYTDGGGNITLAGNGTGNYASFASAGFWDQGSSKVKPFTALTNPAVVSLAAVESAIQVGQNTANPTLGNGLLAVTVAYYVVAVS